MRFFYGRGRSKGGRKNSTAKNAGLDVLGRPHDIVRPRLEFGGHWAVEWRRPNIDPQVAAGLARRLEISPLLATLLLNRGLSGPEAALAFLNPSLADLPSPFLLPDLDRAADRLVQALKREEIITVYGDYDADGLTAAALLTDFLQLLGAKVNTYIPDRVREGYGLNTAAMEKLAGEGTRVLVTVDCGISDFEAVARARALGLDVILTDHHQPQDRLPPALAVVNPKRNDSRFPQRSLAGVGVAFFLAGGLRQVMREQGFFSSERQPELAPFLALAAIGAVADVVPLTKINRILVSMGLKYLADPDRPGLAALKEVSALPPGQPPTAREVAFRLAPRLNAAGRLGSARPGLELLLTRDADQAKRQAQWLEETNRERRRLQEEMFQQALALLEDQPQGLGRTIVLCREGWPRGLLGLTASKLTEKFYRPTILLSIEDGLVHGSARSIAGFNLHSALNRCRDLLIRFGGHEQAAGLTLAPDEVSALSKAFEEIALFELSEADLSPILPIEAEVALSELNGRLAADLTQLAPFGQGNPEPVFVLTGVKILSCGLVGPKHLKLTLSDGGRTLEAVGFNLGHLLPELGPTVSVALGPHASLYQGRPVLGWKILDVKKGRAW